MFPQIIFFRISKTIFVYYKEGKYLKTKFVSYTL